MGISQGDSHTLAELWELVEPVVRAEGLELYDLERASSGRGGVLRVYLSRSQPAHVAATESGSDSIQAGVTVDDCARVSHRLSSIDRFEDFLGEHSVLEVSSPGVNRRLRRPEHFEGALGERVSLKAYFDQLGAERKVSGHIVRCSSSEVVVREEGKDEELTIPFGDISSARVDFDFVTPQKKGKKQ